MKVTLFRYDPVVDPAPYTKKYDVPWKKYMTVLEVLVYIHENSDPVAFDYNCRGRVCGRCAMMLDGEPVLACITTLDKERDFTLEPLKGFPVIRDFIVDKSKLHEDLSKIYNRIRHTPITEADVEKKYDPVIVEKIKPLEWCTRCGVCQSSCPVRNGEGGQGKFIGPSGLVALAMRHYDPNDEGARLVQAAQEGLFNCILCGKCDQVCPSKEIKHVVTHQDLMAQATQMGLKT